MTSRNPKPPVAHKFTKKRASRKSSKSRLTTTSPSILPFPLPTSYDALKARFGTFTYHDDDNSQGGIIVDPQWAAANIVPVNLPGILPKPVYIHKLLASSFASCITEAVRISGYHITSCASYVPRHKHHDDAKPLSIHSWGAAFDINPIDNPLGAIEYSSVATSPRLYNVPPSFVAVLKKAGWFWGEDFKSGKDPMHFQAARGI